MLKNEHGMYCYRRQVRLCWTPFRPVPVPVALVALLVVVLLHMLLVLLVLVLLLVQTCSCNCCATCADLLVLTLSGCRAQTADQWCLNQKHDPLGTTGAAYIDSPGGLPEGENLWRCWADGWVERGLTVTLAEGRGAA